MASWTRVAPPFLDLLLAIVERIDRRVRRLRPVREGALLWVERHRHRGPTVHLRDGTDVERGDAAWVIHFSNARLHDLAGPGWQTRGYAVAREDLRALAASHVTLPAAQRPVAYTGTTLLASLTRRVGFEVLDRPATVLARLEDWYLRSVLVRWAPDGRHRLERGHKPLRARRVWLSGHELVRRYGPAAQRAASGSVILPASRQATEG